jgi:membrane associated rhomboid family serine protease
MELVEVRRAASGEEAERLALVLVAVGIECHIVPAAAGVGLFVAPGEADRARRQLALFERENAPSPRLRSRPAAHGLEAILAYIALLMFVFVASGKGAWSVDWSAVGAARAGPVHGGAWWRTVTALTLHADLVHLLGNLLFGAVFAVPVTQILGAGLGWLAILLAGALGNGLNAVLQASSHTTIGASTAVFGAVGILSGHARRSQALPWHGRIRRWAPIAAGVMLLVWLGAGGERTDVGAHVAGFVVGAGIGLALARAGGRVPRGPRAQAAYGLVTLGTLALAWLLALRAGPG